MFWVQWCSGAASHVWSIASQQIDILLVSSQGSNQLYVPGFRLALLSLVLVQSSCLPMVQVPNNNSATSSHMAGVTRIWYTPKSFNELRGLPRLPQSPLKNWRAQPPPQTPAQGLCGSNFRCLSADSSRHGEELRDGNGGLTVVITKGSTFMKNEHLVEWFCWISCDIPINPARFNNIPHLGPLGRCSSSTTGMKSCWTHAVEKWKACCSSGSNPFLLNLTWGRFCWWECCPWIQQTDYFWKWAWGMRNEMMWNANTMQSPTHKTKDKHNFDSPRWLLKDGCKMFQLTLPWTQPCQFSESMTRLYFLGDYTCYIVLRHHCVYITCTFDHMFSLSEA